LNKPTCTENRQQEVNDTRRVSRERNNLNLSSKALTRRCRTIASQKLVRIGRLRHKQYVTSLPQGAREHDGASSVLDAVVHGLVGTVAIGWVVHVKEPGVFTEDPMPRKGWALS